ncbi:MAG TPA: glycosyltransferase family 2 protein [Calditrichia bacterium]|nr:glycosyltransferase family 2 protein [Calditrichota bacterium]HQU71485.1 glycosyltransferase family 2 protein [Calditrichia bacterium]HQV33743.1 glycosyltransferase family 2 protein [Calditrichia bacterium]
MPGISGVIITLNEEKNIARCIRSLEGVCDEIIVLDSGSVDKTSAIAAELGAVVLERPWAGYAATKNFANAQARFDYILSIDADEALSEELRANILAAREALQGAYRFNRLTNYCGHWIRYSGWYPDPKTRLFPKSGARWVGDFVHESLQVDPELPIRHLRGDLWHYSFVSLSDHLRRVDTYSDLAAREMLKAGKPVSLAKLLLSPFLKFFKSFFLKQGFRDGFPGFSIAVISAFDVFIRYAKVRMGGPS